MYSLLKKSLKNQIREGTLFWSILRNVKNIAKYLLTLRFKSLYAYAHREFIAPNSIFLFKDELFMASLFPKQILDKTIELFAPKSVLDIGWGTGKSLDYFIEHRIDALGIERSAVAIQQARNADKIMRYNLEQTLDLQRKFEMIWSYEVVEHIRPEFLNNLLTTFSNHAELIVLSAARPRQGGVGHFNEQPESYWIENFSRFGFSKHERAT